MSEMVARIDDWGRPAWIVLMVLGFVLFWPIGLAILAFLIWSGRMSCGSRRDLSRYQARFADKWERKMTQWGMQARAYPATGNAAFDEYRRETLKRLEDEANEFRHYLERLRMAKDRSEFEQFMRDRASRHTTGGSASDPTPDARPARAYTAATGRATVARPVAVSLADTANHKGCLLASPRQSPALDGVAGDRGWIFAG